MGSPTCAAANKDPIGIERVLPNGLGLPGQDGRQHPIRNVGTSVDRAAEIDVGVRRLGCQEGLCRLALGRLAREFLRQRAHHRLGFVRLGDYSRERLGLSAREVQSRARVAEVLEALPRIASAFEHGQISWTNLRRLAAAATKETEQQWLDLARGRTARALDALIREATNACVLATVSAGTTGAANDGVPSTPSASAARMPRVDVAGTSTAGAPGTSIVGAAETLTRACLNNQMDPAGDDEDGVVDGEPEVRFRLRCPRRIRSPWRHVVELARRMAGEQLPVWQAAEAIAAEGLSARPAWPDDERRDGNGHDLGWNDVGGCRRSDGGVGSDPGLADERDLDSAVSASDVSAATAAAESGRTVPGDESGRTVTGAAGASDSARTAAAPADIDWSEVAESIPEDIAHLGRDVTDLDAFTLDARLREVAHAMRRIDWQTGRLLRIVLDLRLHALLGFSAGPAYARDRLGISERKMRALLALERKSRHVPALAEAYRRGELSWLRALTILPVLHESVATAWVKESNEVTIRRLNDEVAWAFAVRDAAAPFTPVAPPPRGALLTWPVRQLRALAGHEALDAEIAFAGPASVVALLRTAIDTFTGPVEPSWRGLEKLLEHAREEWERQPRHRDPVFARDGWRCAVPACSSRKNLHDHHVCYRSRGGTNARSNRVSVCAGHHLHGIHAGRVRAWGKAPDAIHWELGMRQDGPALLRLVGERYVTRSS